MLSRSKPLVFLAALLVIGVVIAALIIPTACAPKQPRVLKLLGSSAGSKTNMAWDYVAKVVSEATDITAGNLPGSEDANYALLEKGEGDITYMDVLKGSMALTGTGLFEGKPHPSLRSVVGMTTQIFAFAVLADSKHQKIEDLMGKKIAIGAPGVTSYTYPKTMLDIGYGMTKEKMQAAGGAISNLSFGDMGVALTDKTIEMACLSLSPGQVDPNLAAAEALGPGIRLLSPSPEAIAKVRAVYPGFMTGVIKGGLYKNHPKDVPTIAYLAAMAARKGVPEDVIYDFMKVAMKKEHRDAVYNMVKWEEWRDASVVGLEALPIHPGALKWHKENGADVSKLKVVN